MFAFRTRFAAVVTIVLLAPAVAVGHPFHISSAEIEYASESDRLQVSLKLQAVDMERALARMAGKRIKLEQADVDQWLVQYLARHLYLRPTTAVDAAGNSSLEHSAERIAPEGPAKKPLARSRVHWVGSELKGAWMWLYFELELPPTRDDLQLVNTVLFDTNTGQINTVSVRHAGQRIGLKLTSQQPSEKFPAQWMTP